MTRRSETVSLGTQHLGSIEETDAGFEVIGPTGQHVRTATTIADARQTLYAMHRDGQAGQMSAGGR